ncbi:MAG TPA: ABC transporter ATP-binding protein [Longimicrobiaceae bacterium]|nr:ABC transporter ATP-binding protein [Longimicrobiaceae bacterium]
MASVSLVDVTRSFGAPAVDGVTLHVEHGESLAVLGPSGCGKTTLLRLIAGLEAPDRGTIAFDGQDVTRVGAQERGIGMVFQNYALYPHMDSKRNLGFFFKMHRREPETEERMVEVCQIMGPGFRELLNRKPKELSGGQQQRVAIGRCIIRNPRAFLFDEPLSNLDAKLRAQTRVEIRRLIRRFGITTFYVTHDQTEAIAICERLAVMRRGRIEQVGTYREVYDRPLTAFVAGFVGSPPMNLFDAQWLPPGPARGLPPGAVRVGLRPEAMRLARDDEPALEVRTVVSEPLVTERQQLLTCTIVPPGVTLGTGAAALRPGDAPEIVARLEQSERIPPGTPLRLAFDLDRLHAFGADGRRLAWQS